MVVRESKAESTAQAVANELAKAPSCRRIVFETGRMAPILFHGLSQLGLPVVCVESRQAYQALKSLATHKTDRNDARGLAHLARTGFFKPVHVKSLPAHAVRSLISARKKLVGQRVTLENQIRGLAVVFGVRLPLGRQGPGLLRMLMAARDDGSANFATFTSSIDCEAQHPLTLLASGREQDDAYVFNLEAFDWGEFFTKGGGSFLERRRNVA
jgi:transposase